MLIAACSIAKSDIWETTKANLGFIAVLIGVLLLCSYVPWFSLVLIKLFYGSAAEFGRGAGRVDAHRQHAGDMQRVAVGAVVDLMPARGAVGDDQRVGRRLAHRRQQ